MKIILVCGFWDSTHPKASSLFQSYALDGVDVRNGGTLSDLEQIAVETSNYDLVLWMPNIDNIYEDIFPTKKRGGVLIVSKVLRENRGRADAVQRIFKFHGNATIAITKNQHPYEFELIDALNNTWIKTVDFVELVEKAKELTVWTTTSLRENTTQEKDELDKLLELNKRVADAVIKNQERFFGNISTRCQSLFPSYNYSDGKHILVSARNTNKQGLTRTDMVVVHRDLHGNIAFLGERKPSVDTPIQLALYELLPQMKYMIHGHNQVVGAKTTQVYYPCGDKRETAEIMKLVDETTASAVINIKNHGFLILASSIDLLENEINDIVFETIA